MKTHILVFALLLSVVGGYTLHAQDGGDAAPRKLFVASFGLGYGTLSNSTPNELLPTSGAEKFNSGGFAGGGYFHFQWKRGIFEFGSHGVNAFEQSGTLYKTQLEQSVFTFKGGYALINKPRFRLYPLVGIGAVGTNLKIANNQNLNLGTVLSTPFQEITLNHIALAGDVALGADYRFKGWRPKGNTDREVSFILGARTGYFISAANNKWRYSGGDINGGPSYGPSGFYAQVTVGIAFAKY